MLPLLALLVALLAGQSRAEKVFYAPEDAEHHFDQFIGTFNKQYANEKERNFRLNIFKENLNIINQKNSLGHADFGITRFTDLTKEEFRQTHTGLRLGSIPAEIHSKCKNASVQGTDPAPDALDWRTKGKVTKVKDQANCGSCWAFSVTGNLEGQYAMKHNKLVEISEQQLVDCDKYDDGCGGGLPTETYTWLLENGGAESEEDYSYKGSAKDCKFDKNKAILQVTNCNFYPKVTEDRLKQILADVGPLSIAVDARDFQVYHKGILECHPTHKELDHAVLLVGYGKEGDKPYWIIKNSWNTHWGEDGYVRLAMNKNSCGMLGYISSAVVA